MLNGRTLDKFEDFKAIFYHNISEIYGTHDWIADRAISILKDHYPNLSKEWHSTKNGEVTPDQVTTGSGLKVWWQCDKGHEWQATVHRRARKKSECQRR